MIMTMSKFVRWLKERLPGWRTYWTQRGVVPRWQYLCVYVLIVGAGAFGQIQTSKIANKANGAVIEIQHSRIEIAHTQCDQQNQRNRAAYLFLRNLPNKQHISAQKKDRLLHDFTDALVGPRQDCGKLLLHRFGSVR